MLHSFLLACREWSKMKKTQKDCWYFMVLLILLGLTRDAFLEKPADSIVKLQQNITLECLCPWSGNLSMISWVKVPEKKQVAVFAPNLGVEIFREYKGRVEFLRSSKMDGSISIHNTMANDTGLYQCSIQTFPKGSWVKHILVEHLVDMDLSVAVVEKGHTFLLRCNYVDKGSVYLTFEKFGEKHIDTIALCNKEEGRIEESFFGADYRERALVNCSDTLGVSLRLVNVTEEDGGVYRCHFSADASSHTTTVSLTVSTEGSSMNTSLEIHMYMYMYVGGGVFGLILMIMAITLICWHKKKKRREREKFKLNPMQKRPLNNYGQPALYDKMKKKPKHQEENHVYANIPSMQRQTKRKT